MNAGDCKGRRLVLRTAAAAALAATMAQALAVDNPDVPDRVAAFEQRAAPLEAQVAATDGGSAAARAGRVYAQFLDAELNTAFKTLSAQLQGPVRDRLRASQRQWLAFRDAEFQFIDGHWSQDRVGSSATLSVAGYRNALVKQRIVQLLRYSAEY